MSWQTFVICLCHVSYVFSTYITITQAQKKVVGPQNYILFLERRSAPTEPRAIDHQRASEPHAWPHVIDVNWSFLTGSSME